ncbi:hypothetical protein BC828DRAFT_61048 [Blastocladiella britannica]|nr:hypothetical protein BC828DRAFT_61048 [Blastocladiella britannica]
MMATDTKATCWICYGDADLALDDDSDRWVKPCKCKGTLALVHEQCLLGYIASKHNDDEPTPCPNCGVNYVMQDTSSPVIRFFEALDGWLKRLAPFYVFYVVLSFLLTPEYFEMVMPASLSHWAWVTPKLQTAVYTVMTVSALRIFSIPMLVSTFLGGPKATTDPVHVPFAEIGFWPPSMAMAFVTIPLFMLFCNFAYTKAVEVYLLPKAIASNELLHTLRGADGKPSDEYENELDRTRVVLGIPDSPHRLNKCVHTPDEHWHRI